MLKIWAEIDVTNLLEAVQVPTLLLVHEDRKGSLDVAEYMAANSFQPVGTIELWGGCYKAAAPHGVPPPTQPERAAVRRPSR